MTNYQFNIPSTITYTHMTINQSPVKHFENYFGLLQNSLTSFMQYIKQSIVKIIRFFEEVDRTDYINGLEEVFLLTKKKFEEESVKLQNDIINKLSEKKINAANYEMLNHIINAHQRMANELIEKDINIDRIEIISNYLREVIIYLKTDFKVDHLPNVEIRKSELNFEACDEEMIIDNYGFTEILDIHVSA